MAAVVKVLPPTLIEASTKVVEHIETAARPATAVAPVTSPSSPVDVAAHGAATAIQIKMAAMSTELAPKGPALQAKTASAAAALQASDAANALRMPSVPSVPSPSAPSVPQVRPLDVTFKQEPPIPPPGPVNPFPGWTDQQKQEVAVEIANGHASRDHYPGVSEPDLARRIYNALTDPRYVTGSDDGRGLLVLGKDGIAIYVKPGDPDFGTAFDPQTLPGLDWHSPEDYFDKHPHPIPPLAPPPPGRLPPVAPGDIAPTISQPPALPSVGQHPAPNPLPPNILDHPPTTSLPPNLLDHPPLPPWLQDPSPPGFQVTPGQPPDIFHWDHPDPVPAPPVIAPPTSSAPGPSINIHAPQVSPDDVAAGGALAAAGAFGAWVLSQLPKLVHPFSPG